jgi:alkylation response protein AidB-like acyl-CoA dehydrogenase
MKAVTTSLDLFGVAVVVIGPSVSRPARTDLAMSADHALSVFLLAGPVEGVHVTDTPDTVGYRSHATPTVALSGVRADDVIATVGSGAQIGSSALTPASVRVAVFGLALTRAAFDFARRFARTELRGDPVPIIDCQLVGQALVSAKTRIEAVRSLTWRARRALDHNSPFATELAIHAKIFGSDIAVAVITGLMRVVGLDSYSHAQPLGRLRQDILALPVFGGANIAKVCQAHAQLATTA